MAMIQAPSRNFVNRNTRKTMKVTTAPTALINPFPVNTLFIMDRRDLCLDGFPGFEMRDPPHQAEHPAL